MGVNYIGGCCGCKATHMREMAKALGKYTEESYWKPRLDSPMSETENSWDHREEVRQR